MTFKLFTRGPAVTRGNGTVVRAKGAKKSAHPLRAARTPLAVFVGYRTAKAIRSMQVAVVAEPFCRPSWANLSRGARRTQARRMNIVHDWPPNIDQIDAAFNVRGQRGVIFSLGRDHLRARRGIALAGAARARGRAHGAADHGRAQAIQAWWDRYIADIGLPPGAGEGRAPGRVPRVSAGCIAIATCARKCCARSPSACAGPLYGKLVSYAEAKKFVEAAR
jgi:hypothetical protein